MVSLPEPIFCTMKLLPAQETHLRAADVAFVAAWALHFSSRRSDAELCAPNRYRRYGTPIAGWFIMVNPKTDDLGVALF